LAAATPHRPTDRPQDHFLAALREALGWDETTYDSVKQALIEAGTIIPGRGRGGSVSIRSECE